MKLIVQLLHQDNQKLKKEIAPTVISVTKDMKKKCVTWTEILDNIERMVEHQPRWESLERQGQAASSFKDDDIKGSQGQITQFERLDPQGGRSQALEHQGGKF